MTSSQFIKDNKINELFSAKGNGQESVIWAVCGDSPFSGASTVSAALSLILSNKGFKVETLCNYLDWKELPGGKEHNKFENLDAKFIYKVFRCERLMPLQTLQKELVNEELKKPVNIRCKKHILVDLGTSLSHNSLDIFLIADVAIIMTNASSQFQNVVTFYNLCIARLFELLFPRKQTYKKCLEKMTKDANTIIELDEHRKYLKNQFADIESKNLDNKIMDFKPYLIINKHISNLNREEVVFSDHLFSKSIHLENDYRFANCMKYFQNLFHNNSKDPITNQICSSIKKRIRSRFPAKDGSLSNCPLDDLLIGDAVSHRLNDLTQFRN